MTKYLKKLDLTECSRLVELPSSIGNITNLERLKLNGCSSLVELPSTVGNLTNLEELNLSSCSNFVKFPLSIGNLHNLQSLCMKGCSKLMTLPVNINFKSLDELDLSDCSSLKSFPEISTNIKVLKLYGTAIEEIPTSIRTWSRLDRLHMPYSGNLKKSQHAFDLITDLHLSSHTGIEEIAPWVKEMSRLKIINGCTKLISLPHLSDSLEIINADNCESLERLDCSFYYKTKLKRLNFVNCFKLNQEAKDLIIKTSTEEYALFPGEKVPAYFTYRATGSSLPINLIGLDTNLFTSLRFKACLWLVNKGGVEAGAWNWPYITYNIKNKLSGNGNVTFFYSKPSDCTLRTLSLRSEHLAVFEFETTVDSPQLIFTFYLNNNNWEIKECGARKLGSLMLVEAEETIRTGFE